MAQNNQTSSVNIRLTRASKKDMQELSRSLVAANKEVTRLQKAFKDLGTLQKRAQVGAALNTPGFQRGQRVRAGAAAERTAFSGTRSGKELEQLKLQEQQEKSLLRLKEQRLKRSKALGFSIARESQAVQKLTSQEQLKSRLQRAQLRVQMEAARNAGRRVGVAQKLVTTIQERIKALKEEQRVLRQNAQLTDKQKAAQSRAGTRERLFGDGGANLFAVQAGLIANFMIIGGLQQGLRSAVTFTVELDEAMRNLQAIVRVTDTNIEKLKGSLIEISEETKFTAVEVTNAAVTLGQAGFSVDEIRESARAVTLLATATRTDLARAVDIATSVLGVFQLQSSEMANVANIMTSAVNNSKLNIEKLTLGMQYSGNIAAQSGVRFEELTAAFGAMANAGIRAGSTLGTGMRQILIALQKPSGEFKSSLDRLGLSMQDVDIQSKGLAGVLMTLSEAGFTSSDAIRSFEVRAASAFNALARNTEDMISLEASFTNTTAAAAANETQMKALANQGRRLVSVLGTIAAVGLNPMKEALIPLTESFADMLSWMKEFDTIIQTVTISISLFMTAIAALLAVRLVRGLTAIALGTETVAGAMGAASAATTANTAATAANATTMRAAIAAKWAFIGSIRASIPALFTMTGALTAVRIAVAAMFGPIGILVTAISGIAFYLSATRSSAADAADALEKARTAFDDAAGAAEKSRNRIESVDGAIEELVNRQKSLRENSLLLEGAIGRVRNQFSNMGRDSGDVGDTVEDLIESLSYLRRELAQEYKIELNTEGMSLDKLLETQRASLNRARRAATETASDQDFARFMGNPKEVLARRRFYPEDSVILNKDATGNQIAAELSRSQEILRENVNLNEAEHQVLKQKIGYLKKILGLSTQVQNTIGKQRENARESSFMGDQARPGVSRVLTRSSNRATASRNQAATAAEDGITARQRVRDIEDLRERLTRQFNEDQAQLEKLNAKGQIDSPETFEALEENFSLAMGYVSRAADQAAGAVEEIDEELAQIRMDRLGDRVSDRGSDLSDADTAGQVNEAIVAQVAAINDRIAGKMSQLEASDVDPELMVEKAAEIRRKGDRELDAAYSNAEKKLEKILTDQEERSAEEEAKILDLQLSIMNRDKSRLSSELEEAETVQEVAEIQQHITDVQREIADRRRTQLAAQEDLTEAERSIALVDLNNELLAEARALRGAADENRDRINRAADKEQEFADDLIKKMNDQVKMQRLILLFGEDSFEVTKERARVERENFEAMVKTKVESEELRNQLMRAFDVANRFKNLDLGKPIRGAMATARGFLGVLSEMGGKMRSLKNEGAILDLQGEYADDPVELARQTRITRERQALGGRKPTPIEEAMIQSLGDEAAANERQRSANREAADTGGGGGDDSLTPAEQREEELRRLLAKFENASKAAEIGIETGSLKPSRGINIQEGALGETKQALQEREASIARIQQKVKRTADEEERLTALLEEHSALNRSIEQQEKRISQEKGRQGILQLNILQSTRDWARANLDLNATMEGGLKNTLSSMTSGFSELFQKLSTEPKKAGQAFLSFARTVAQAMQKALAEMMAVWVMQKILGMAGLGPTTGMGSVRPMMRPAKTGGLVRKADGGEVEGNLNRDSVPHLLMPGEFVLRKSAADAIGIDHLKEINAMGNTRMASGGHQGVASERDTQPKGGDGTINFYLVDERSQAGALGPNDILAVVNDDIARGGSTKKLIRSVHMGVV